MNNGRTSYTDDYRLYLVLDEIEKNGNITQRDLSKRLALSLGLVNSYIKNLASKGYITVSAIPRKRYAYYLTPKGMGEKARLTYHHLQNFTNLYRVARMDFSVLFNGICENTPIRKVAFCGADEVAEIAFLSLGGTDIEFKGILDKGKGGGKFFGHDVLPLDSAGSMDFDLIVITSFRDGEGLSRELSSMGVRPDRICDISRGGWLKRLEQWRNGKSH